jgi:hypothetical protein
MLASAVSEYPLHRKRQDPEYATQSHDDQMRALAAATRDAIKHAGIRGDQIEAIALDITGSSPSPLSIKIFSRWGKLSLVRSPRQRRSEEITAAAHREKLETIEWFGIRHCLAYFGFFLRASCLISSPISFRRLRRASASTPFPESEISLRAAISCNNMSVRSDFAVTGVITYAVECTYFGALDADSLNKFSNTGS